jgi:hypothetical protein
MCPRMVALRDLKLRGRELDDGTCAVSIGQVGVVGHDVEFRRHRAERS